MKVGTQASLQNSSRCQGTPKVSQRLPKGSPRARRGSQGLPKGNQKGIQNGTQNGSRFLCITRDPIFHKKVIWIEPARSKGLQKKKTGLSNGTGSAFLSLETFERVGQHVPKQSRTPHSCAWPTNLRIYLSIYLAL